MFVFRPEQTSAGTSRGVMLIKGGFNIAFDCVAPTPMILMVSVRSERQKDFVQPEVLTFCPAIPYSTYLDGFGNTCTRLVAPPGRLSIWNRFEITDSGLPEQLPYSAYQHTVADLPEETLPFLLGSRYCETQLLMQQAWFLFGHYYEGWPRVEAILNYVHNHLRFSYRNARSDRTAFQAYPNKLACAEISRI